MRIQYLSDLHFEFHADGGAELVASLSPQDIDVLIVAGDLAVGAGVGKALDLVCTRYAQAVVLYVHGNHEFYGTTREAVVDVTARAAARHPNLRWLDAEVAVVGGQRFLGAPLWFRPPGEAGRLKEAMNDFHQIRGFESWVYAENARAIAFFERELQGGDVVLTHYLPTQASILPKWRDNVLNPFFVCDVESVMRERRPKLWFHGHTHDTVDAEVGTTRVLCNPFGYVGYEVNPEFCEAAVVDLDAGLLARAVR